MHAEAWALTSEYRDRPEWACFLKDCTILDSYSIPLNLNSLATTAAAAAEEEQQQQQQQQKKLHFEDYLIKVSFVYMKYPSKILVGLFLNDPFLFITVACAEDMSISVVNQGNYSIYLSSNCRI